MLRPRRQAGFSLVEAVIIAGLSALIFGALFASFQSALQLINDSRARLSAVSVANDRMEYIRSLPYDEVGTIAGIPNGPIPQQSTTTLNGIEFQERVLIEFFDDPADGQDTATTTDDNGIPSDYKRVKVEYTWQIGNATNSLSLISNIVPRSVETDVGGGSVRINVIGPDGLPLPGAEVRLQNFTTTSTIDVTRFSNAGGTALFSGAPAASDYEVWVSANIAGEEYSQEGTYRATTSNPNPILAPFAVLESDVSTLTFQIGRLSDLIVNLFTARTEGSLHKEFIDFGGVATSSDVAIDSGSLVLADAFGSYEPSGTAYLDPIAPVGLTEWGLVRVVADLPSAQTGYRVRFYTGSSTSGYTLIPDGNLNGNSSGFIDDFIDLSELSVASFPEITAGIELTTTNSSFTPYVYDVLVHWRETETPHPGYTYNIHGNKTIGTDASSSPIYKFIATSTTDGSGSTTYADREFDSYVISTPGYDLASACPGYPIPHEAGVDTLGELILVPNAANTLRVTIVDSLDRAIPGAEVNLTRSGYDVTTDTDLCGAAFFSGGVPDQSDFTLTVSAPGYVTEVIDPLAVFGDTDIDVTLNES